MYVRESKQKLDMFGGVCMRSVSLCLSRSGTVNLKSRTSCDCDAQQEIECVFACWCTAEQRRLVNEDGMIKQRCRRRRGRGRLA